MTVERVTPAPAYIEERIYLPDGMAIDDRERHAFQVGVFYRGGGCWMVASSREGHQQLTHTGRWLWSPPKFVAIRWCRHDFDTACRLAEAARNDRVVSGRTWAQWQDHHTARADA